MEQNNVKRSDHNPSPADLDPERNFDDGETRIQAADRPIAAGMAVATFAGTAVVAPDVSVSPRPVTGDSLTEPLSGLSDSEARDLGTSADPLAAGINAETLERVRQNEAAGATAVEAPPGSVPEVSPVTAITDETGHTTAHLNLREGTEVVGMDGEKVGEVKAIRMGDFLVHRPLFSRDVYVPFECVQDASGDRVTLTIPAGEVGDQGWAHPS